MIDNLWILFSSGLVFLMQAGFLALETGLTRTKNNINVALKNLVDFSLTTILFWVFGFAIMFGTSLSGWIGTDQIMPELNADNLDTIVFLVFQVMFCGTAVTIIQWGDCRAFTFWCLYRIDFDYRWFGLPYLRTLGMEWHSRWHVQRLASSSRFP
jgi:ammonia channel protein AmtB